jgi:hypothetical protein
MRSRYLVLPAGALLGANTDGWTAPISQCGLQSDPNTYASSPYRPRQRQPLHGGRQLDEQP